MRITLLTIGNPWDIHNWSGIPYHISQKLKEKGYLESAIGVSSPKIFDITLKVWYGVKLKRRAPLWEISARNNYRRIFLGLQALTKLKVKNFAPGSESALLSTTTLIDTRVINAPAFVYLDATFFQAYTLNPNYKKLVPSTYFNQINQLEKKILKSYKGIFVFSEWVKASLLNDYGLSPDKITVVGYGANLPHIDDFDKRSFEKPILLSVTTDFYRKGGEITTQVYRMLKTQFPELRLVLAGKVPSEFLGKEKEGIEVVGFLRKDNLNDFQKLISLYKTAAVFILPSYYDTMPNVILESMYFKTPVVASNVCGIPEMVKDGEAGFVVKTFNPEDYAERIASLLRNDQLRWNFGENARKEVLEKFTWDVVTSKMIDSISKAFGKPT